MVYPRAHGLLTILGDAYTASEIWQTGVRLDGDTAPSQAQFDGINTAVQTFLQTAAVSFPAGRRYIGLKWAPQDVNGKYGDEGESVEWFRPTPVTGAGAGGYPQIACVLSLRTGRVRGYASNGRMYIPSAAPAQTADGRITAALAGQIATAGATLIAAINQVGLGPVSVMSAVGAGRIEAVTGVRVGRVMDTMRSRRNGLAEEYPEPAPVPT